jgi:tetratricopeptide (TPR) repeat protein
VKARCLALALALVALSGAARADDLSESKNLFKAGAAAYAAGDYLAAIQALEAAHRLTPLPAIAFSLAQAERRQYFVSREPAHLTRAIELFRRYLSEVPSGGRRADAADALAQLEPLAAGMSSTTSSTSSEAAGRTAATTRLMVSADAPGARVVLDGAAPVASPLIAEVTAGEHTVSIAAPGFVTSERKVVAIAGALVPVEVLLEERPAVAIVEPSTEVDLYVDGAYVGWVRYGTRVELSSGVHQLAFARKGRRLEILTITLERGSEKRVPVKLHWTAQRMTAVSLLAVSGATLLVGLGATGAAVESDQRAADILARRDTRPLTEAELDDYDDAVEERDRYRAVAVGSLAVSLGSLVGGIVLHEFDRPNVRESLPQSEVDRKKPAVRIQGSLVPAPRGVGLGARFTF